MHYSLQQTANGLGQQPAQSDSMEELLPVLRRFTVRWEQNIVLGDHRWQWENMKTMQGFAKDLSEDLLGFDSRCCESWDAEVRSKIHVLSTELRQFVRPDMRRLSVHAIEVMVAHGRITYELTRGLISYLEPEKLTRKPSDEQ